MIARARPLAWIGAFQFLSSQSSSTFSVIQQLFFAAVVVRSEINNSGTIAAPKKRRVVPLIHALPREPPPCPRIVTSPSSHRPSVFFLLFPTLVIHMTSSKFCRSGCPYETTQSKSFGYKTIIIARDYHTERRL